MKFDFFTERATPLIGVDISSTSVKMVELAQGSKGAYHLQGYAIAPIAKDAVVDGNIVGLDLVADAVKRAWKLLATRERRVAVALPAAAVISKKVLMQAGLREEDMEFQVEAEANQYIPFSLDEVNIDFQELGPAANNPNEVEVLIAAARKEKIEDRVAAAEGAGLKVVIVDVETYATEAAYELAASALPKAGKEQTVMVVDVGALIMHVHVLHDNQAVHSREQAFGGYQLSLEIQRRFGISPEEAELAKRNGGLPDSYEAEVLQPFVQSLAQEVARGLQFFTNSTQYNKVDQILLAGGCAAIPGVAAAIQEKTQVNTVVANPFNHMSINPRLKQQQVALDAPALMNACGLALRRFD
ncbi:pilus assembly protein PilM [Methylobacillus gramineus]|uniref:pilus assembly protein PilM n=1 Tax=Methylobacillus gramineus TaxID=755169 RepID=UPI001D0009D8|nr:pilus assembly protein PilM [Methylobacillus gramineus]MCB5186005.1 pilus assembly protein PilM [Methylobacillus gramineus]